MSTSSDRITPEIIVHDGPGAVDFHKRAFGAEEASRMMTRDGKKLINNVDSASRLRAIGEPDGDFPYRCARSNEGTNSAVQLGSEAR